MNAKIGTLAAMSSMRVHAPVEASSANSAIPFTACLARNVHLLDRFADGNGGESPPVIVGEFRNRSTEHIPVGTFVADLERAFVNSGAVTLLSGGAEREEIRDERYDQQENARAGTRAAQGMELGARYMLQGELQSIEDRAQSRAIGTRKEMVVFYQVDARMVDLESNVVVWAGQHKIKKYVERPPLGL
jgi:hypothetical protein